MISIKSPRLIGLAACIMAFGLAILPSCERVTDGQTRTTSPAITVGVTRVTRKSLSRSLTLSSELVPFQEIDVYAKESGYVTKLLVDYGTHVKKGQLMAVLEIPELVALLQQDQADVKNAQDEVQRAEHELKRWEAQYRVYHLENDRLSTVAKTNPGLVAQQEVDDVAGKDLAAQSQVEAGKAALAAARSHLAMTQAKQVHDQALYDYSRITAPFSGVITERYANLGALMQAGTNSSTQAMPLVRLSQDDLFRLVIPVPESSVRYIRVGDPVDVVVPSLNRTFPGKVARFSVDVREDTRTMHTEVDVPNPDRVLIPGVYAEAVLTLEKKDNVLALPLEALNYENSKTTVYVVNNANEIEDREVKLGMQTAKEVEIVSGVSAGEQVVVSDRSGLKPGENVRPKVIEMLQYQEQNHD